MQVKTYFEFTTIVTIMLKYDIIINEQRFLCATVARRSNMDIGEVRKNTKILIDGTPYNIDEADFMKPGKGRAIYRLKLRNLVTGSIVDRTYHSGEKVEEAHTTTEEEQYLYRDGENYVFMNNETFEQQLIHGGLIGDRKGFL